MSETITAPCPHVIESDGSLLGRLQAGGIEEQEAAARIAELEARLREAEARAEVALREKAEAIRLAALARNDADRLRGALEMVEAWMASETGPICKLWEDGDIGAYDDNPTNWEQTLSDVRDWKNGCVPTASLGYGVEWAAVTLYREVLSALQPQQDAIEGEK